MAAIIRMMIFFIFKFPPFSAHADMIFPRSLFFRGAFIVSCGSVTFKIMSLKFINLKKNFIRN